MGNYILLYEYKCVLRIVACYTQLILSTAGFAAYARHVFPKRLTQLPPLVAISIYIRPAATSPDLL